jgi:hypothetical protein
VLGILAVTSEWSQRTGLVTFTLEPRRGRVLSAKVAAVIVLGLVFVVLLLVCAVIGNFLGEVLRGGEGEWTFGADETGRVLILQLMGLLGGLAFGTILLNSAAAIVLSFVLPLATGILFEIVPGIRDAGPEEWTQLLVTSMWWIWIPLAAGVTRVLRSELKSA